MVTKYMKLLLLFIIAMKSRCHLWSTPALQGNVVTMTFKSNASTLIIKRPTMG